MLCILIFLQELYDPEACLNGIAYHPDDDSFFLTGECIHHIWDRFVLKTKLGLT